MKAFLRSQLEQHTPALFYGVRALRLRRYFHRQFAKLHADFKAQLFPGGASIVVQCGPFRGLRYFDETVWGSITPKWLGSYEAELHDVVRRIAARRYKRIIDVGCAEGYYAVGLAMICPTAEVVAFDTDFISRNQVRRLAQLNDVTERVQMRSYCSHGDFETLASSARLVVCDVEGAEVDLLDPARAPSLHHDDILVELHETSAQSATVEELLRSRFEATHRIERIASTSRGAWIDANRLQFPPAIEADALQRATEENRMQGQAWLWMQRATRSPRSDAPPRFGGRDH